MLNGFSKYFEKNVIAKWEEKSRDLTLNHLSEDHNFKCGEIRCHESALTHHTIYDFVVFIRRHKKIIKTAGIDLLIYCRIATK